jgi:hypothetical protein
VRAPAPTSPASGSSATWPGCWARAAPRRGIAQRAGAARHPAVELLFDPQTSGGLLFSVPRARAEEAVQALHAAGDRRAAAIGSVAPARSDAVFLEIEAGVPALDNTGGGH